MINGGIMIGTYLKTTEIIATIAISRFFYVEPFIIMSDYKDMKPDSNQQVRLYGMAKT